MAKLLLNASGVLIQIGRIKAVKVSRDARVSVLPATVARLAHKPTSGDSVDVLPGATFGLVFTPMITWSKLRSLFDVVSGTWVLGATNRPIHWYGLTRRIGCRH